MARDIPLPPSLAATASRPRVPCRLASTNRRRCTILSLDDKGQPKLSTKTLEAVPGQMLTDPQAVYDNAIKTAKANRQKEKAEAKKRLELAESVIIGLEDFGEIEHTCKTEVHSNKESVECKPL